MVRRARPRLRLRPLLELRAPGRGASSPATSTWPGTRRWRGCGPSARPSARAVRARAVAMRDTDCDLDVGGRRAGRLGHRRRVGDLRGTHGRRRRGRLAAGHAASRCAPRGGRLGPGATSRCVRHDVGVGKHGDHIGGERDAARALMAGEVDAACMIDGNHLLFATDGTLPPGATRSSARPRLRPLQLHRARTAPADADRAVRDAAPRRCRTTTRRCGRCSTSKG